MKIEKIEALKTLIDALNIVKTEIKRISPKGNFVEVLQANNLVDNDIISKKLFLDDYIMKLYEASDVSIKLFSRFLHVAEENMIEEEKLFIKEQSYLDLRDLEDIKTSQKEEKFFWVSEIEID